MDLSFLTNRIAHWLEEIGRHDSDSRPPDPDGPAGRGRPGASGAVPLQLAKDIRQQLRRLFESQATVTAGCIHFMGLASLRQRLGPRWSAVKDRVLQLAERLIARHLSAQDVWFRYGEDSFVIVFNRLNKLEAQLVCAKIIEQLHGFLLGDADAREIVIETVVFDVGEDVTIGRASLAQLLSAATQAVGPEGQPIPSPAGADGAPPLPVLAPPDGATAPSILPQAVARIAASWQEERLEPLRILFRPVWDAKHQVMSTFIVRPNRPRPGRSDAWGYEVLADPQDLGAVLDLDLEVLSHSVAIFQELYQNRFRFVLSLPLHFETLAVAARRRQYLQLCRVIPRHLAPLLMFHLVELPKGIPYSRLMELLNAVRPFCRGAMAVTDFDCTDHATYAMAGIRAAGVVLHHLSDAGRLPTDIAKFAAMLQKVRLQSFLDEIPTHEILVLAEAAGVSYLSGDAVGAWAEVPSHMTRVSRDELLARSHARPPARDGTLGRP